MKNGDYVKVTDAGGAGSAKVGDIAVITNENWLGMGTIIDVKTLDGREYGMLKTRFTPATPEEVAQAQAEAQRKVKEAQETAKWAAIGRKVGEFKRGDIVEATRLLGKKERVIGEVEDVPQQEDGGMAAGLRLPDGTFYAVDADGMALITPVEQRFDTEQAA
jgi:hypothetical protein